MAQPQRVGQLMDELARRWLVRRREDPQDRRRTTVRLTEAGRVAVERLCG